MFVKEVYRESKVISEPQLKRIEMLNGRVSGIGMQSRA